MTSGRRIGISLGWACFMFVKCRVAGLGTIYTQSTITDFICFYIYIYIFVHLCLSTCNSSNLNVSVFVQIYVQHNNERKRVYHVESVGGCSGVISICEGLEGWKVMGKWCNSISIKTYVLKVKREQK